MAGKARSARKLQSVSTRLFAEDVKELKRLAQAEGIPWQVFFRVWVHKGLQRRGAKIA